MKVLNQLLIGTFVAYVSGVLIALLTVSTMSEIAEYRDAEYWRAKARAQEQAQASCITDMECEQAYGYDMGGQPL